MPTIVRFNGYPLRFERKTESQIFFRLAKLEEATRFESESKARQAVKEYGIRPPQCVDYDEVPDPQPSTLNPQPS